MIFITELKHKPDLPKDNKSLQLIAIQEANYIYNCLYILDEDLISKINDITILVKDGEDINSLWEYFNNYNADFDKYGKEVGTICESFPEVNRLSEPKRKKLETLLRDTNLSANYKLLLELKDSKSDILVYLPYCDELTLSLLRKIPTERIKLYSNQEYLNGFGSEKAIFLDFKKFVEIKRKVKEIQNEFLEVADPYDERHFRLLGLLECIGNNYYERVLDLENAENKRLQILGKDHYISFAVIDQLLNRRPKSYYYLPKDLNFIKPEDCSVAIMNFDSLTSSPEYKKLYEKLELENGPKEYNHEHFIILQAIKNIGSRYFVSFDEIEFPGTEELEREYTRIFLRILVDRKKYKGDPKKLATIKGNVLFNLIPKVSSFEELDRALRNFREVTLQDLKSNHNFWYFLDHLVSQNKNNKSFEPKEKIILERNETKWIVYGLGSVFSKKSVGLLYAAIVILYNKHCKKTDKRIYTKKMQDVFLIYTGKKDELEKRQKVKEGTRAFLDMCENDRGPISGRISEITDDFGLKEKIASCIKGDALYYFYNDTEIEIEVIDERLESILKNII